MKNKIFIVATRVGRRHGVVVKKKKKKDAEAYIEKLLKKMKHKRR